MAEETAVAIATETTEVPIGEVSMQEFKKARAEGKDTVEREAPTEEKKAGEDKPKARGGFQAKIDRLIKQTATLEEQLATERREKEELKAKGGSAAVTKTEQSADGEPQRENFTTEAEYIRAITRWEVKQELKAEREAEEKKTYEAQVNEARSKYNSRMIALQAENEDYKELMSQDIKIPTVLETPITLEMDNGPEVAIYLAQNPEFCEELLKMTPSKAIAEAWKISEKLAAGKSDEGETEEEEEEEDEPEEIKVEVAAKPKAKAPAPIRPVSGGTSRSTVPLGQADFQAYKKLRAQGRVQ
jgi:hypothetical protein